MAINALHSTSTKFEEVHFVTEPSSTGDVGVPIKKRAFFTPSLTVNTTGIHYFLTLDPNEIKGNVGFYIKGSLNPITLNSTFINTFYKFSYYFEIFTSLTLQYIIDSYPTTSTPGVYFHRDLIIKNMAYTFQTPNQNPPVTLLSPVEDNIVELNPSGNTTNPDIRFGLNFNGNAFGDWMVNGMVYSF